MKTRDRVLPVAAVTVAADKGEVNAIDPPPGCRRMFHRLWIAVTGNIPSSRCHRTGCPAPPILGEFEFVPPPEVSIP